ncbi:SubName: Full=Related to KREV-1 novel protein of ras superfamily KREV-1 {ECO:0000313/EMBL:CCA73829.1} [Serendipita indica DSM 11827]|nr:SubName: Full=Related to KREV-1 novel protein of ras superfamily KREV-1 {ECO:0000313/EMBL:CCA73829.1} [Serendipita indica DSM 11827]
MAISGFSCLEVLDTAGTEQFVALHDLYIKAGRGFILAFSLTDQSSLKEIEVLREQIVRLKGDRVRTPPLPKAKSLAAAVPIVVVGTKSDLVEERQVDRDQMMNISLGWGVPIYETSAKKNWHVKDAFEDLVRQMRIRYPNVPRTRRKGSGRSRTESARTHGHPPAQSSVPYGDGRESPKPDKCVAM